jgi:L-lactate dehydrogenase complex protein LldG
MAEDRARIFAAIAAARSAQPPAQPYPDWDDALAVPAGSLDGDLADCFRRHFEAAAGRCVDSAEALAAWLAEQGATRGYCDPSLAPLLEDALAGRFELRSEIARDELDALDFAITRAVAGVAETGSLVLGDAVTRDRLAAVATWIHVAVLDPAAILPDVRSAIAAVADDPYAVFVSGPSQTADVEGILIRGVHGPGEQICLLVGGV